MEVQIIQVPYDSGHKEIRMGSGPAHLVEHGLGSLPGARMDRVEVEELPFELGTTFRVLRSLSEKVRAAVRAGRFPLVLAGNCVSSVGTLAGLDAGSAAIVWLDAHGDFNTPETTVTGFFDGMALATATPRCWQKLTSSVPGFCPTREKDVILIGARDFDPQERLLLNSSSITLIDVPAIRSSGVSAALNRALNSLNADRLYLHIDLDVLDSNEARVNQFASAGGLKVTEVLEIVRAVAGARPIAAAAIAAYDPTCDTDGKALRAGTRLMQELHAIHQGILAPAN